MIDFTPFLFLSEMISAIMSRFLSMECLAFLQSGMFYVC